MPPSFLTRQKCTIIRIEATIGMPMQCQMYDRSKRIRIHDRATQQSKANIVIRSHAQLRSKRSFMTKHGVARAMFVPTVTAQNPS